MVLLDVAICLKIVWDSVKDIVKRNLQRRFSKPKLGHLRNLAIDEISVAKGHKYLTVVLDLDSGAVVFVGDGKGAMVTSIAIIALNCYRVLFADMVSTFG